MKNASIAERFLEKVKKTDGCWEWLGHKNKHGYGLLDEHKPQRKIWLAHRVSWNVHFGDIPKFISVCHSCDNTSCVNPAHLFLGTHTDNMEDMRKKNRNPRGEKFGHSKLTNATVLEIRSRYASEDITQQRLADHYGVSISQINCVVNRNTWKHV